MAGLLDFLMQPAGRNIFGGFFPEQNVGDIRPRADTPLFDITASKGSEGWNINLGKPGALTGDTFAERFGAMQPPQQQAPAPLMQPPQQAQAAFDMPTGSYAFGGQMVPTYGQAQPPVDEATAQRRSGGAGGVTGIQINPQGNPAAPAAVAPGTTSTGQDRWMEFLDRFSPDYVSRYRQTQQQQKAAQNLSTFFQGQGMNPQQANAMAAVAAQNPKIMEEFFKQPATVEGAIARDMAFGTGGGGQGGQSRALDWMQRKNAAEKAGTVEGESRANAKIDLPGAVATAKEQLRLIDELSAHPGRKQIGWHDPFGKAPLIPSTKGYDANNLLEQIKSGAFMTAFQTLKGGGQITQIEGEKATAAITRMDRATSRAEFDKALEDYKGILRLGIDRASQKAGQAAPYNFQGNQGWGQLPGGARFKKVSD
jgi:hypothetical protein